MTLRSSNTTRTWHWPLTLYSKIKPCHNTIVFKSTLWEKNEERGLKKNKSKVKYASDSITLAPKMLIDFGFPQTCENDLSFCLSLKKKKKKDFSFCHVKFLGPIFYIFMKFLSLMAHFKSGRRRFLVFW